MVGVSIYSYKEAMQAYKLGADGIALMSSLMKSHDSKDLINKYLQLI
jgi:thiamine monophosphate synthase